MAYQIVVLSDGETYTSIDGCRIYEVPEELMLDIEAGELKSYKLEGLNYWDIKALLENELEEHH